MAELRLIAERELDQLLALYRHLHDEDEPLPPKDAVDATWRELLDSPRYRYFGAYEGGLLVASCNLAVIPNLTRGCRPYGVIENVVTHVDSRGKGLGKAVLAQALQWAWSADCYKVMLQTGRLNEATFAFYEAAGFSRHGKQAFIAKP